MVARGCGGAACKLIASLPGLTDGEAISHKNSRKMCDFIRRKAANST